MREDWIEIKLGEALSLSKEKHKPDNIESIFYIGLEHIEKGTGQLAKSTNEEEIHTIKNKFNNGDILYGKLRPNLNKAHLAKCNGVCSTDILVLTAKQGVLADYCLKFMLSRKFVNDMSENTNGVNLPRVSTQYIQNYHLPLAPLPEQRAIAAKIEQLFSELDNGIASFKTAQAQLEIYRQSVLKKAFEGELTKEWRVANRIDEQWKTIKTEHVVKELSQGWSPKCDNEKSTNNNEWAVIKTSAIQHGQFLDHENKVLPKNLKPRIQHEIKNGDILITRAGPRVRVGVCCLVKNTRPKLINCDKVYCIKLYPTIKNNFFEYRLNSLDLIQEIENIKTGGNDSGVNLTQNRFLEIKFDLPSIAEQEQIVQEIESRLSVCDKLAETIKAELDKAEALRQSILKKAFEGRLLTDAELAACRQEPDWEAADKLLKRIKEGKKT